MTRKKKKGNTENVKQMKSTRENGKNPNTSSQQVI